MRSPASADPFSQMARLLDLEAQAEADRVRERVQRLSAKEAEATGQCLAGLVIREEFAGLGGRWVVTLGKRHAEQALPWTRLDVGSPVLLTPEGAPGESVRGVISERRESWLRVALNADPELEAPSYRLDLTGDEIARIRQRAALDRARGARRDRLAELRAVLLGEVEPQFVSLEEAPALDASLNSSQREAIAFALAARDLALLHGPPGTGKTTTVIELIRQAVRRGQRVLACAPSNLAVDNLLERLVVWGTGVVRLGHPARVLPGLRAHTLDLMVEEHEDVRLARKLIKEARGLFREANRWTRAKPEPGVKRDLRQEGRALINDARRLERQAVQNILDKADVVCATLTGLDEELLGERRFDLLVIDEACQTTEPACWLPLNRVERVVLAGDPCQLPPTILSREAMQGGFGVSLMERLVRHYGDQVTRLLTVQYRMHEQIMEFSSLEFYDALLVADASVARHRLCDLPGVQECPITSSPAEFLDTAGASFEEETEPDGESRLNRQEADLVCRQVRALVAAGVNPTEIAVIAPYAAQVRLIRERLGVPGVEVDSVDGFQGREKEAIILSMVRSNPQGEIGFLGDLRRTNVALTRARRKVLVVGDSATLATDPFYARLVGYFETLGAYRTVWEET